MACRWDALSTAFPFGRYCDGFYSGSLAGFVNDASAMRSASRIDVGETAFGAGCGSASSDAVQHQSAAMLNGGAWYPVRVEALDTRLGAGLHQTSRAGGSKPGRERLGAKSAPVSAGKKRKAATETEEEADYLYAAATAHDGPKSDSADSDAYYRVYFIGYGLTTLLPLSHLRPLSAAFQPYVKADQAAEQASSPSSIGINHGADASADDAERSAAPESESSYSQSAKRVKWDDAQAPIDAWQDEQHHVHNRDDDGDGDALDGDDGSSGSGSRQAPIQSLNHARRQRKQHARRPKGVPDKWWSRRHTLWTRFDEGVDMAGGDSSSSKRRQAGSDGTASAHDAVSIGHEDARNQQQSVGASDAADIEPWYSVTPECAALHAAKQCISLLAEQGGGNRPDSVCELATSTAKAAGAGSAMRDAVDEGIVVLDLFAGVGGNTIAFARLAEVTTVVSVESTARRCDAIITNAAVYGVSDKVIVLCADVLEVIAALLEATASAAPPVDSAVISSAGSSSAAASSAQVHTTVAVLLPLLRQASIIFSAPPWGGVNYQRDADRLYGGYFNLKEQMRIEELRQEQPPASEANAHAASPVALGAAARILRATNTAQRTAVDADNVAPTATDIGSSDGIDGMQLLRALAACVAPASAQREASPRPAIVASFLPATTPAADVAEACSVNELAGKSTSEMYREVITHLGSSVQPRLSRKGQKNAKKKQRRQQQQRAKQAHAAQSRGQRLHSDHHSEHLKFYGVDDDEERDERNGDADDGDDGTERMPDDAVGGGAGMAAQVPSSPPFEVSDQQHPYNPTSPPYQTEHENTAAGVSDAACAQDTPSASVGDSQAQQLPAVLVETQWVDGHRLGIVAYHGRPAGALTV